MRTWSQYSPGRPQDGDHLYSKEGVDAKLAEVLEVLSRLKGVKHAFCLTDGMTRDVADIEKRYPSIGPLAVKNDGMVEVAKREYVACIIKDRTFRAPPKPTVQLVDDDGAVIGKEILPGETMNASERRKVIFLGKDFVIYADKGRGKGARFVLPPVPFAEVEAIPGVRKVCSSSPSTMGDLFIRRGVGLDDDPKLASIVIGFNLTEG